MRFHEKLKDLIAQKGYSSIKDFHDAIVEGFVDEAITDISLYRLLKHGVSHVRETTLFQLSETLKISQRELLSGTDLEKKSPEYFLGFESVKILPIDQRGPAATSKIIIDPKKDSVLDSDKTEEFCFKSVFILHGFLDILLIKPEEIIHLKRNEAFSFDSRKLHKFRNPTLFKTSFLLIHYPTSQNYFKKHDIP